MEESGLVFNWLYFCASFALCLALLQLFTRVADRANLLDVPGQRKIHQTPTPLVGGICIFLSLIVISTIFAFDQTNWSLLLWLTVVLAVGVVDDLSDLSYKVRLLIHFLVVVGIWLTDGLAVQNIGAILSPESVVSFSTFWSVVFTAVAVIGAVNAVNMIDGVDGLLGSLLFISLVSLLLIPFVFQPEAGFSYSVLPPAQILMLLGALGAFLVLNARFLRQTAAKVYMGDAGSTVLGFLLVYVLIDFTQGDNALFSPVVAGWILGVPLLDASAVILSRVLKRQSPVKPGRDHLHHLLLYKGLGVKKTVLTLVGAHISMIVFAVSLEQSGYAHADMLLFWGFIVLVIGRVVVTRNGVVQQHVKTVVLVSSAEIVGVDAVDVVATKVPAKVQGKTPKVVAS